MKTQTILLLLFAALGWGILLGFKPYLEYRQRKHTEAIRESIRKKAELVEQFAKDQELNSKDKT